MADDEQTEMSSCKDPLRKLCWLVVLVVVSAIALAAWSIYSAHMQAERIADLEKQTRKIIDRLEAERVGNRLLASASITVEVVIASDYDYGNGHYVTLNNYARLGSGSDILLEAVTNDSFTNMLNPKEASFRAVFSMPGYDKMVGQPLRALSKAQYLQIEFMPMPDNQRILRGKAVVVLNGGLLLEFEIPAQKAKGRRIVVPNIQKAVEELMQK